MNAVNDIFDVDAPLQLSRLGIEDLDKWKQALMQREGMLIVAGPMAAGKSTTAAATFHEVMKMRRETGLRGSVALINDLRDEEAMKNAIGLARSGVLIICILHAKNDVPAVLQRLSSLAGNYDEVMSVLNGVIVQCLVQQKSALRLESSVACFK